MSVRYRRDGPGRKARYTEERKRQMAAKTKTITVQVDERLAAEIEGTTVHNWRTTTFASGKRRVYATFESVKTVGGMK